MSCSPSPSAPFSNTLSTFPYHLHLVLWYLSGSTQHLIRLQWRPFHSFPNSGSWGLQFYFLLLFCLILPRESFSYVHQGNAPDRRIPGHSREATGSLYRILTA